MVALVVSASPARQPWSRILGLAFCTWLLCRGSFVDAQEALTLRAIPLSSVGTATPWYEANGWLCGVLTGGMLCLVVVWQAIRSRRTLHRLSREVKRLQFIELISQVATELVRAEPDGCDQLINDALVNVGRFERADRVALFLADQIFSPPKCAYEWTAEGVESFRASTQAGMLEKTPWHWLWTNVQQARDFVAPHVASLPDEFAAAREWLVANRIRSVVYLPLNVSGDVLGFLTVDWIREPCPESPNLPSQLKLFAQVLANTIYRQRLDQALRESESRYRSLFDEAINGIMVLTRDGTVVAANPAICRMYGCSLDEFLQNPARHYIHPDSIAEFDRFLADTTTYEPFQGAGQGIRIDGETFDWELHGAVITFRGEPHLMAMIRDVSRRVRAEERLQAQEELLMHNDRLTTMGEMLAGIAHEVNQPLFTIVNFADACENLFQHGATPDLTKLREWNEQIRLAAQRSGEIIRRIRKFLDRRTALTAACDINQIVHASLALLAAELRRRGITVTLDLAENLPKVNGDVVQIQQVLVNLIRNAAEILSGTTTAIRLIAIRTRQQDDRIYVSVSDTGPGVSEAVIHKLFDPFETTKVDGMGMGLAICRRIIDAHDGKLTLESSTSSGATFAFTLPTN